MNQVCTEVLSFPSSHQQDEEGICHWWEQETQYSNRSATAAVDHLSNNSQEKGDNRD